MNQILLITVSGEDQAGVTAGLTAILAEHAVNILDIGQAVIHAALSLGLLVELPEGSSSEQVAEAVKNFALRHDLRAVLELEMGVDVTVGNGAGAEDGRGCGS